MLALRLCFRFLHEVASRFVSPFLVNHVTTRSRCRDFWYDVWSKTTTENSPTIQEICNLFHLQKKKLANYRLKFVSTKTDRAIVFLFFFSFSPFFASMSTF